jgi:hypothetical protein
MSEFRRRLLMAGQAILSCFSSGVWRELLPWLEDERWKEN